MMMMISTKGGTCQCQNLLHDQRPMKPGVSSISALAQAQARALQKQERTEDNGSDDEDFLVRYRQQRKRQLQPAFSPPEFRGVEEVDPTLYSKVVDATDPRVYLVVHLYETYVPAYRDLIHYLERISETSMTHVRFLSLRASAAIENLDPIGLPSVLIHKAGKLVHNLTPFSNHVGEKFGLDDVKQLLEECCSDPGAASSVPDTPQVSAPYDSDDEELDEFCKDFNRQL